MVDPVIDAATLRAYEETEYRVLTEPAFTLRAGQASEALLEAHLRHGTDCSAFVTACNPYSERLDAAANAARQRSLAGHLAKRGLAFVDGVGRHPHNRWPGEPSFLVFGMDLDAARALGERLRQNAIVWSGADGLPRLVLLR